jgi:hypothetical protein
VPLTCPHCKHQFNPKCCVCRKDIDAHSIVTDNDRNTYCSTKCFVDKQLWIRARMNNV